MANPDFDAILTTTLNNHRDTLVDNIFSARPLFFFLQKAGQIRTIGGGVKIVLPILDGFNSTAGSYSKYDTLDVSPQEGITAAEFPWKQYAVSVAISGIEEAMNNSEEEVIDLLESKVMQAEETVKEQMDNMFITGDGTGNGGKDWLGLEALVKDVTNPLGGIDPTSDTYWKAYKNSNAGALTLGDMRTAYNTTSEGNDAPELVLTTQTLYEKYESLLQPQLRYSDAKTADAGFQNLLFKGSKVCFDKYVTAGDMFFINPKYLRLVGHKDKWFTPTPFVRPNNVDARFSQILCYGNMTISNRSRQGVLTDRTA